MRRWLIDRVRLAVRWAFKRWGSRVFVFAHMPTKGELDAVFSRIAADLAADLAAVAAVPSPPATPGHGKTLH